MTAALGQAVVKVAVFGAAGRMGQAVCRAVLDAPGLDLVAQIDADDDPRRAVEAGAQVAVDFTHPGVTVQNIEFCVRHGIDVVVGTSGFDEARQEQVRALLPGTDVRVLVAPNFSIGAVLMMRFAAGAAPYFESVEIVELHHPDKVDAPSGTATRTAELIAEARAKAGSAPMPDATKTGLDGARGATVESVPVHSVRLRGLIAHQEVLLGTVGETLTIRHDSLDRASFMPGVVLACKKIATLPAGLTVGLDALLDL
ncbi:4-hydroxy-tetrahydrodipicolinate reductase [Catenulispora sp. NF23]|uniref:4-hydroxy-tetrahydrodipicolinate reductase n=1 Tax=Catenulispora pinistramenti TaxID=2705254 RepID=A0ABS5L1T7_9ACTN|nr:4-hydroxy-tetrahydrodipicolinate reductase [Catenulispora pinistramenti]MBS2552149.1 4-hydroxy-tetrahydrodipicolinate reductase [Catenulispora pinistramenti]